MQFLTSALGRNTPLVHTIAGVLVVLALVLLIYEVAAPYLGLARKKPAPRVLAPRSVPPGAGPPLPVAPPAPRREPDAPNESEDDAAPETPQVFLLCQDDVEPDEATFPYARILVSARGDSDAGKKRARNEDSFLLMPDHSLFAVADGMGGYHGGKVASTLAVDTLKRAFEKRSFDDEFQSDAPIPRRGRELATALVQANRAVFAAARAEPELAEMGTTMVAARFSPDKRRVYVGHVGDSRCYRFRGSRLAQLTTDHTMRHLGLEGPHANDLFRAVGIEENVVIDLVVDIPQPEDIYLLCSDGLPKMVSDEQIQEALRGEPDLEAAVYRLIELANDAGGRDNVTVILVRVREQLRSEVELSSASVGKALPSEQSSQTKRKTIKAHAPVSGAEPGSSQ